MSHASLVAPGCTSGAQISIRTSESNVSVFEKLPREIRDMIYELCLCVDGAIQPYPEWAETNYKVRIEGPIPEVALLALNKRIRDEALDILFGKNEWRITAENVNLAEDNASRLGDGEPDTLWHRYGSRIQKVDLKYSYHAKATEKELHPPGKLSPDGTAVGRYRWVDPSCRSVPMELDSPWMAMTNTMDYCPNIESLRIDVHALSWGRSCCRTNIVHHMFTNPRYMAQVGAGVEVSVSGIYDDEQRGHVIAWRTRGLSGKERDEAIARTQVMKYKREM